LKNREDDYNLHPDLIFFTGDIALGRIVNSSGLSLNDQYEEAKEFLEKIRKTFSEEIPIENIFIGPGNQDVNRTLVIEFQFIGSIPLEMISRKMEEIALINN
jgi:hypothetical protein